MDLGFDFSTIGINGILIIPLIVGLVQFAKSLGLQKTQYIQLLAFGLGVAFMILFGAIEQGLIPPVAVIWINVVVFALAGGIFALASMGLYDLAKQLAAGRG